MTVGTYRRIEGMETVRDNEKVGMDSEIKDNEKENAGDAAATIAASEKALADKESAEAAPASLDQDVELVPGKSSSLEDKIKYAKLMRVHYANHLNALKQYRAVLNKGEAGRHASIAITELENVRFRLGMVLQELGLDNPYPNGNNPDNALVDPPTDVKS